MQRLEQKTIHSLPARLTSLSLAGNLTVWPSEQQILDANDLKLIQMHAHRLFIYLDQHFYVFPDKNKINNIKNLNLLYNFFNVNLNKSLNLANQMLNQLMPELINYFRRYRFVKLFYDLCVIQLDKNNIEFDNSIFAIDQTFLARATAFTEPLAEKTYLSSDVSPAFYCFNSWLTPEAIAAHRFRPHALEGMLGCWKFIIETLYDSFRSYHFVSNVFQYLRPLMNLHHDHLEHSLIQLRAITKTEQTHYSALCAKISKLERKITELTYSETEVKKALSIDENTKPNYKKTLNKVTAVLRYGPLFKSGKHQSPPSAVVKMIEETEVKMKLSTEQIAAPALYKQLGEQKNEDRKIFPLLTTFLFDLVTLKIINEGTVLLLEALEKNSFWRAKKIEFRDNLIQLINEFNSCFKIPNVTDKVLIEKGNLYLKNLMNYIQHSSTTDEFSDETQHDLGKLLTHLIFSYGRKLKTELNAVFDVQKEIIQYTTHLYTQVSLLETQIDEIEQSQLTVQLEASLQKETNVESDPYKQALINIVTIISFATDIELSPQLIPELLKILRYSYSVLIQFDVLPETKNRRVDLSQMQSNLQELTPATEILSWESLLFISQYSRILIEEYNKDLPAKRWSLRNEKWQKYLNYCQNIKPLLEKFNGYFATDTTVEGLTREANIVLVELINWIENETLNADDFSFAFCKIYEHEKAIISREKRPLLGWYHLEELNKAGKKVLIELKQWPNFINGYYTNAAMLVAAMESFNKLFLQDAIHQNQDANHTLKPNKALLCFIQLFLWHSKERSDITLSNAKCIPFLIQYNQYTKDSIEQLHISIQQQKEHERLLQNVIDNLQHAQFLDERRKTLIRQQIRTILTAKASKEAACITALLEIIAKLENSTLAIEKNILALAKITLRNVTYPEKTGQEEKSMTKSQEATEQKACLPTPLLPSSVLKLLQSESKLLLTDLTLVSGNDDAIDYLITLVKQFNKPIELADFERQANKVLSAIMHDIHMHVNSQKFNDQTLWAMQRFLIEYSLHITHHLQLVHEEHDEYKNKCNKMTREIDYASQQNQLYSVSCSSTYFTHQSQLQKVINDERRKSTPAEENLKQIAMMVLSEQYNPPDSQSFTVVMQLLQSVNCALFDVNKEQHSEKYSFKFR